MVKTIIDLLHSDEFYNVSETVELAKGKNEIVTTFKGGFKKIARAWRLKKRLR